MGFHEVLEGWLPVPRHSMAVGDPCFCYYSTGTPQCPKPVISATLTPLLQYWGIRIFAHVAEVETEAWPVSALELSREAGIRRGQHVLCALLRFSC